MQKRSVAAFRTMLLAIFFGMTIGVGHAWAQAQCASDQYTYTFTNYCSIPVWVGQSADTSNVHSYPPQGGNWELAAQCTSNSDCTSGTCDTNVGQCTCTRSSDCTGDPTPGGATCQANGRCARTSTYCMPKVWTSGTFWPRTFCTAPDGTHLNCQTGQCTPSGVNGLLDCGVGTTSPVNPVTQFEVTSATPAMATNFANYDVSLVAGENVEMKVTPVGGSVPLPLLPLQDSVACYVAGCSDNLNATCPANLQVKSGSTVIGCLDPCTQCQRTAPGSGTSNPAVYTALMCNQPIQLDSLGVPPVITTDCNGVTQEMPTYQDMYCAENFVEATRATNKIPNSQASSNQGTATAFSQADCFPGTTFIVPSYPNGYKPPGGVCLDASPQPPNTTPNVNDYGWKPFGLPVRNCNTEMELTACGGYLTQQASYANALGYACHTVTYADTGNNAQTAHLCLPPVTSGLGTCT